jgi:ribosomal protein L13E
MRLGPSVEQIGHRTADATPIGIRVVSRRDERSAQGVESNLIAELR